MFDKHKLIIARCKHKTTLDGAASIDDVLYFSGHFVSYFLRDCLAMAGRIFAKSLPKDVCEALFINGGTPWKLPLAQKIWWLKTSIFGAII